MNSNFQEFIRSDLACERRPSDTSPHTVITRISDVGNFSITELTLHEDSDHPKGRYVTVDIGKIWYEDDERISACADTIACEIMKFADSMCTGTPRDKRCIMVAGLGNRFMTADALGPMTVDKLTITRHMMGSGGIFDSMGCCRLCAVQPGVLAQTGVESAAIIKGAATEAMPDVLIAVDALAARSISRLSTTVQISGNGICPGSGIGNRRTSISKDTVGCPVIAVGIPTVVDSSTLVIDALEKARFNDIPDSLRTVLETGKSFFVSPKESDIITDELSSLLANAIEIVAGI